MAFGFPVFILGFVLANATPAATAQVEPSPEPSLVWIEAAVSADAPAGNWSLGLALDLAKLGIAASVGEDISGGHFRAALAMRLKLLRYQGATLDAGPILGYMDGDERDPDRWQDAYRLGAEAGITYRISERLSVRGFGGLGTFLNRRCCLVAYGEPQPPRERADHPLVPHAGVSFNVAMASLNGTPDGWKQASQGWYGLPLLAVDVLTAALWAVPLENKAYPWIAGLAAAPTIHAWNGHPGRAVISMLIRTALPFIGAGMGMAVAAPSSEFEGDAFEGAAPGAVIGWFTAAVIDDVWLARGTPTP